MAIEVVRTPPAGPPEQPPGRSGRSPRQAGRASRGGPDPLSIALFSLALLMVLVALLAHQLTSSASASAKRAAPFTLVRKIYRTRVIETIIGPGPTVGPAVTQSVASSGSMSSTPVVSTHTS